MTHHFRTSSVRAMLLFVFLCLAFFAVEAPQAVAQEPPSSRSPRLAILPVDDQRPHDSGAWAWVSMIPLFPYGHEYADRPETMEEKTGFPVISYNPAFAIPQTIAENLRESGIFQDVAVVNSLSSAESDLVLKSTLRSTRYDHYVISYGISVAGMVSWLLGFPSGVEQNTVVLTLELVRKNDPDRAVWRADIDRTDTVILSPYYKERDAQLSYITFVREAVHNALGSLSVWISDHYRR